MQKTKPVNRLIKDFEASSYAKNDKKNVKLRKAENTLYASGFGLILLGAWQLFELVFRLTLDFQNTRASFMVFYGYVGIDDVPGLSENAIAVIIIIACLVFSLVTLIFQCMAGIMAMEEAKRKKIRRFYLVMAVCLIQNSVMICINDVRYMTGMIKGYDIFQVFGQEIFDVLLVMTALIMLYYGIRVKVLRLSIKKAESKKEDR